jgi:hypothetical protein
MTAASSGAKTSVGMGHRPDAMMGLRLIIGYKFVKAIAELLIGASFFFLSSAGLADGLTAIAEGIRHHVTEAWSLTLAERLIHASRTFLLSLYTTSSHNVYYVK